MLLKVADDRWSVRAKLGLLVLIACVGLVFLGGGGLLSLWRQQARMEDALTTQATINQALVGVETAHACFKTQVQEWKNILLRGNDGASFDKYLKQFVEEENKVQQALESTGKAYAALGLDLSPIAALRDAHAVLGRNYRSALDSFDRNDSFAGQKVDRMVKGMDRATADNMTKLVKQIEEVATQRASAAVDSSIVAYGVNRNLFAAAFLTAVLLLATFAVFIVRALIAQLGGEPADAVVAVRRIAGGDLTGSHAALDQAPGGILKALSQMCERLQRLVAEIDGSAQALGGSADKLHGRAGKAVAAAERQSETAQGIAAGCEELAVSIAQATENACCVEEKAIDSGKLADEGAENVRSVANSLRHVADYVDQTATQINALGQQSGQISQIVQVIREIAEQTNLLALNAAIEAARAGESGRGFAVVADEVRKLAERTTLSTTQIAAVINSIQAGTATASQSIGHAVEQVGQAAAIGDTAAASITRIQSATQEVIDAVGSIKLGLQEQKAAANDIANHSSNIANEAAGLSQRAGENALEAESLVVLSQQLQGAVAVFRY